MPPLISKRNFSVPILFCLRCQFFLINTCKKKSLITIATATHINNTYKIRKRFLEWIEIHFIRHHTLFFTTYEIKWTSIQYYSSSNCSISPSEAASTSCTKLSAGVLSLTTIGELSVITVPGDTL